jgi:hypothetical protein
MPADFRRAGENSKPMTIELDKTKLNDPLTFRERVAIRILMTVFEIILPVRYSHQVQALTKAILGE